MAKVDKMNIELSKLKIDEIKSDLIGLTHLLDTSLINKYGTIDEDVTNAIHYTKTLHLLIGVLETAK